jgi:hypothetical protein
MTKKQKLELTWTHDAIADNMTLEGLAKHFIVS